MRNSVLGYSYVRRSVPGKLVCLHFSIHDGDPSCPPRGSETHHNVSTALRSGFMVCQCEKK